MKLVEAIQRGTVHSNEFDKRELRVKNYRFKLFDRPCRPHRPD
jgi:hypothetical protein